MNSSSAKERRALILRLLEQKDEVLVTELSRDTGISEVTIRKDLTILQNRHLLLRTRGGAMRKPVENQNEDTAISKKQMFNFKEKERIGIEATQMIKEGDFIVLDSGTTTLEIAKHLDKFQHLRILTNAMNIATELVKYNRFDVVLLGGNVRAKSLSMVGPLALSVLRNFSRYKLFLGVDSFSIENGVSTPSMEEALLNQIMIQQHQRDRYHHHRSRNPDRHDLQTESRRSGRAHRIKPSLSQKESARQRELILLYGQASRACRR